jgi:hypothetical protein
MEPYDGKIQDKIAERRAGWQARIGGVVQVELC